jgi:hypothetical protein
MSWKRWAPLGLLSLLGLLGGFIWGRRHEAEPEPWPEPEPAPDPEPAPAPVRALVPVWQVALFTAVIVLSVFNVANLIASFNKPAAAPAASARPIIIMPSTGPDMALDPPLTEAEQSLADAGFRLTERSFNLEHPAGRRAVWSRWRDGGYVVSLRDNDVTSVSNGITDDESAWCATPEDHGLSLGEAIAVGELGVDRTLTVWTTFDPRHANGYTASGQVSVSKSGVRYTLTCYHTLSPKPTGPPAPATPSTPVPDPDTTTV